MRDIRVWEPDETCLPAFVEASANVDNIGSPNQILAAWTVPAEHVFVVRSLNYGIVGSAGTVTYLKSQMRMLIYQGDLNSQQECFPLSGGLQNVREFNVAGANPPAIAGLALHGDSSGNQDVCIIFSAGAYTLELRNSISNSDQVFFSASGWTFPVRPR